jgi:hypothetical protein
MVREGASRPRRRAHGLTLEALRRALEAAVNPYSRRELSRLSGAALAKAYGRRVFALLFWRWLAILDLASQNIDH